VDNVQNCDSYINISLSQTYRSYLHNELIVQKMDCNLLHKQINYIIIFVEGGVIWDTLDVVKNHKSPYRLISYCVSKLFLNGMY
jgi:hypothetical protein